MALNEYNIKFNKYNNYIQHNMYILDVEKLCGYSEFVLVHKNSTCTDVCNAVFRHFECDHNENKRIFLKNSIKQCISPFVIAECSKCSNTQVCHVFDDKCDYLISPNSIERFRNIVNNNTNYFKPIYDLPCNVVYKVYLDDGHT